ncbi:hypothetical protein BDZ91DRAFT_246001 [Kalaharituber pfeilii]|nr:hypothetical protein BDZ91DRAFT_246001 [Kalaharituber pfeilii]
MLQRIYAHRIVLGDFMITHYKWFKKGFRGPVPEDELGPMKYTPLPTWKTDVWFLDAKRVFCRYAGEAVWEDWVENGTMIAKGIMSWMTADNAQEMVRQEIHMYTHHRRRVNDNPNYGWLRNSYHSLTQQIARLDPVYYALVVAARREEQIEFTHSKSRNC